MSASSSDKPAAKAGQRWWLALALPLWVLVGFGASQLIMAGVLAVLKYTGVPLAQINQAVLNAGLTACIYIVSLAIVVGLPWILRRQQVSKQEIGLTRLPSWMDIGLAPAGLVIYLLFSIFLVYIAGIVMPGIDMQQVQETGFANLAHRYEYVVAFVTLVVVAPVAEEVLFRGYLYGKLRKIMPMWVTMLIVSALFGLVHGQWNVAIDVFALSMVLCSLREITGNIWAGIVLHMLKNSVAFYFLFINPTQL